VLQSKPQLSNQGRRSSAIACTWLATHTPAIQSPTLLFLVDLQLLLSSFFLWWFPPLPMQRGESDRKVIAVHLCRCLDVALPQQSPMNGSPCPADGRELPTRSSAWLATCVSASAGGRGSEDRCLAVETQSCHRPQPRAVRGAKDLAIASFEGASHVDFNVGGS